MGKRRKHCGKRRKCWLTAFSPFPTMISEGPFFFRVRIVWKKLNYLPEDKIFSEIEIIIMQTITILTIQTITILTIQTITILTEFRNASLYSLSISRVSLRIVWNICLHVTSLRVLQLAWVGAICTGVWCSTSMDDSYIWKLLVHSTRRKHAQLFTNSYLIVVCLLYTCCNILHLTWKIIFCLKCRSLLTHYQTTNFRLFQTERVCRRQFHIWRKWKKVIQTGRKHCGKRRNRSLRAISPFPTVFSKGLFPRGVKRCHCVGMG